MKLGKNHKAAKILYFKKIHLHIDIEGHILDLESDGSRNPVKGGGKT